MAGLTEFSDILLGKNINKCDIINLFFPQILDDSKNDSKNLLDLNQKDLKSGSGRFNKIFDLNFSLKLRKNSFEYSIVSNLNYYLPNDSNFDKLIKGYSYSVDLIKNNSVSSTSIEDKFKSCLYLIDKNQLIPLEYIKMIYIYIINESYEIALMLISSLLVISPQLKSNLNDSTLKETKDNLEKYLTDYTKFLGNSYNNQEYIPITQTVLETTQNETFSNDVTLIHEQTIQINSQYTNTRDKINRNYFVPILQDASCTELQILSRFANGWSSGEEYELLTQRLEEGSIVVKMLLMDINTSFAYIYNDSQNHVGINPARIFERLSIKYPNNFYLRYVTIPLTNGLVHDVSNQKLRVDYLTMPPVSNKRLVHYFSNKNLGEKLYYEQYATQFEKIWNEYSKSMDTDDNYETLTLS